jgi:hypothetical protein
MPSPPRLALATLLALAALAGATPSAHADADPPSDILLLQDVYFPFQPKFPAAQQKQLTGLVAAAKKKGFQVKVAIVATSADLGAVPAYFGKPQPYATFLASEITQPAGKQTVLAVMPAGFGVANPPSGGENALRGLSPPRSADPKKITDAAVAAVRKLAAAAGHPVSGGAGGGTSSSGGASPLLIFGVPVLLVALAALILRLKTARDDELDREDEKVEPDGAEPAGDADPEAETPPSTGSGP